MFGIFKKKVKRGFTEIKKMENRDAVEAAVWFSLAVGFADGECDAKEVAVMEKTIAAKPAFAGFAGEVAAMIGNVKAQFEASPRSAMIDCLKELADIAGTSDAPGVLCLAIDVADQDGIDEKERGVLKRGAEALGLRLETYLLD